MSLINDALKRAQESQRPNPPGSMVPLRPVERLVKPRRNVNVGWMIPVAVICLIAAAFLFIGLTLARHSVNRAATAPEEISQPAAEPAVVTAPPETAPAPVAAAPVAPTARPAAPNTASVSAPPATAVAQLPLIGPAAIAAAAANSTASEPAKPALVIQGIVNDPVRPWAIISGRTLFIGDTIKGLRVTAIARNSVTLVGGGETNRLIVGQQQ